MYFLKLVDGLTLVARNNVLPAWYALLEIKLNICLFCNWNWKTNDTNPQKWTIHWFIPWHRHTLELTIIGIKMISWQKSTNILYFVGSELHLFELGCTINYFLRPKKKLPSIFGQSVWLDQQHQGYPNGIFLSHLLSCSECWPVFSDASKDKVRGARFVREVWFENREKMA